MKTKHYLLISLFLLIVLPCFFSCTRVSKALAPLEDRLRSEIPFFDHVQSMKLVYRKGMPVEWETEVCFPMDVCITTPGPSLAESVANLNLECKGVKDACEHKGKGRGK